MLSSLISLTAFLFAAPNAPVKTSEKGFAIYDSGFEEISPAAAYNFADEKYLVEFLLPAGGRTTVKICDMLGREVAELADQNMNPGRHSALWDGRYAFGNPAASGVYFYRIQYGTYSASGKMLLMR
jgi:hypothetical protein